jgi:plastocyanin
MKAATILPEAFTQWRFGLSATHCRGVLTKGVTMRKAWFGLAVILALSTGALARAETPANVQTIDFYRSSFTPSMMWDASGVVVTLVNRDSSPHTIALYRQRIKMAFSATIQPGERYTVPEPLTCTETCANASYVFADADRSYVSAGYCYSFCARLSVYNTGP